jgi:hypothetical protein
VAFQLDDEKSKMQGRSALPEYGCPTYPYRSNEAKQPERDAKRPLSFNQLEWH